MNLGSVSVHVVAVASQLLRQRFKIVAPMPTQKRGNPAHRDAFFRPCLEYW